MCSSDLQVFSGKMTPNQARVLFDMPPIENESLNTQIVSKKETPPKRSYKEIMNDFQKAQTPKEYRAIHKELKRDYKDGISIWYRYPYLSLWISIMVLAISCFTLLMRLLK